MNRFFQSVILCAKFWVTLLLAGCLMVSYAQKKTSKATLQKQAQKLETQIRYNSKLLEETTKNKTTNLNQLVILNDQIHQRDKLIKTINTEISVVSGDIQNYEERIVAHEKDIKNLKDEYAKLVKSTQRHVNPSEKLMFIVASESFNQAYRRLRYFQQYSAHRKKQVVLIRQKQSELMDLKQALEQEKTAKTKLLTKEEQEKKSLDAEKVKKNQTLSDLQKKEKQLRAEIQKSQAEAKKLTQQIEKIIAEEIEAARKAAAKKAAEDAAKKGASAKTSKPGAQGVYTLTPAEKKLSDDFASNRGKLPWPTERGVITEYFGTHEHPTIKNVMINNDGIDITTNKGEIVRAVFNGIVTGVHSDPYGSKMVFIVHGNYRTVYIKLKSVNVKQGQKVSTKQPIGVINTSGDDEKTVLKFQIWRDLQKLNPSQWIASK